MRTRSCWLVVVLFFSLASPLHPQHVVFIHHSVGSGWLGGGLQEALAGKTYIDGVHDITYGTAMSPDAGRPASLGSVPGDSTDMNHWVLWFNDYLNGAHTRQCSSGFNEIIMFKSCFPNSDVSGAGTEPGDPFSWDRTLANYRAVYRHPNGAGHTYSYDGYNYRALEEVFAAHPDILFIPVTAPPLSWSESNDENAHRARLFNNWLKNDWLNSYNSAHPGLHNVAVFDFFDVLAYPDGYASHPDRLRGEYGGDSGDSHPNGAGNAAATDVFATDVPNFLDQAWAAFKSQACAYTINPTSRNHGAGAEAGTISVITGSGCGWTAKSNDNWITVTAGAAGSGNGTVSYSISANETEERNGTITVAGRSFHIRQVAGGPPNQAPEADAGPDQQVFSGDSVSVQGAVSDPDGDDLTFAWTQLSGLPVTFDAKALTPSFVAPTVTTTTLLEFELRAQDSHGAYGADSCVVTVTPVSVNTLVFPAFFQGVAPEFASSFVGVAVSNLNSYDNTITVRGMSEKGQQVGETIIDPPLPAQGQKPFLTAETLDPGSGARTAMVGGNHAPVRGFFMVGEDPPNRLDGIGVILKESKSLYFPLAKRGGAVNTTLYAHNPSDSAASATFKWIGPQGTILAQASATIPAGGCVMKTLSQLFPNGPIDSDGYVRVVSSQKLIGCLAEATTDTYVTLPGEPAAASARLLAPHFYIPASGGGTELRLINVGLTSVTARIRGFAEGPAAFVGDTTREIAPGAMLVEDLATLLAAPVEQLGPNRAFSGYLDLQLTAQPQGPIPRPAYVVGAIVFWGNEGHFATALPLVPEGFTQTLFPHLAQSMAFRLFTGLAILNPGSAVTDVTVTAFDTEGKETGRRELNLAPGTRALDVLNGPVFFGGNFSQNGGYLRISSDHPVVCFSLFGDVDQAYMAAIGGQNLAVQ